MVIPIALLPVFFRDARRTLATALAITCIGLLVPLLWVSLVWHHANYTVGLGPINGIRFVYLNQFDACFADSTEWTESVLRMRTVDRTIFSHEYYRIEHYDIQDESPLTEYKYSLVTTGCTVMPLKELGRSRWFRFSGTVYNHDSDDCRPRGSGQIRVFDDDINGDRYYFCFDVKIRGVGVLVGPEFGHFYAAFEYLSKENYEFCILYGSL